MEQLDSQSDEQQLTFWSEHRFLVLIGLTIIIAMVLVAVGLVIYNVSGASKLDLSRQEFKSVSSQVIKTSDTVDDYAPLGAVNEDTITEFKQLFDKQAESAHSVDAFGGDPLNPDELEFGQGQVEQQ